MSRRRGVDFNYIDYFPISPDFRRIRPNTLYRINSVVGLTGDIF